MKYTMIKLLTVTALCGVAFSITPVTSIGSNPWFSTELYPQDLLMRSGSYFFYNPQYLNSPFWGDIDEPANKPNTSTDYTVTGRELIRNGGTFKHSGTVHSVFNNFGYAYRLNDNIMTSFEINADVDAMRNSAEGNFTGNTYPDGQTIPFNYQLGHTLATFSGKAMLASHLGTIPFGIIVDGGRRNTLVLTKELTFSKYAKIDDSTYNTDELINHSMSGDNAHAFWGWTEPGCNHVFGERGTLGDSWLQNQYAVGPIYHFNLLGGLTTRRLKAGGSFRMIYGHQDSYRWESWDTLVGNDEVISNNYYGEYYKEDMAHMTWLGEGRLFGNLTLKQGEQYSLNTFLSVRYADSSNGFANADNLDAVSNTKDRKRSIELECFPNISAKLGDFLNYIDMAAIFAYKYSRYSNTREGWVGGGTVQTYQTGWAGDEWSSVWENFSYANENVIDLGADISTMFPLFSDGRRRLSMNLHMIGDVRFTYQTKYYGESVANGSSMEFTLNDIRENYFREVILNTGIMFHYLRGPFQVRFQFTKPILYSVLPRTTVTDADGNVRDGFPLEKSPQLISQKGLNVGFYGSYDVILPFLKH